MDDKHEPASPVDDTYPLCDLMIWLRDNEEITISRIGDAVYIRTKGPYKPNGFRPEICEAIDRGLVLSAKHDYSATLAYLLRAVR